MNIVKNSNTVKFPRAGKSVKDALRRAAESSQKEEWTHVIIIGESRDVARGIFSKMNHHTAIGMLQSQIHECLNNP